MYIKSTHHAKKICLETLYVNQLALNANTVNKPKQKDFALLIDNAIDAAGLKKKNVADEAGIHPTSLSRIISCESGIADDTAKQLIKAINNLANKEVINEAYALSLLGLLPDNDELAADGLFSGYYDLDEDQRKLARRQIAAILNSFKEEDESAN